MSRFFKTIQRESGPFTSPNNLLTIDVDDQGFTDMGASYLDFELMFKKANGDYFNGSVELGNPLTSAAYSGGAIIKNIRLESDKVGVVEEIRFQNRHCETMRKFLMTEQENVSSEIRGENQVVLDSLTNRGHVHVPLKQILGCGSSLWPNEKMGPSRLKLELENQVPWSYQEVKDGIYLAAAAWTFANIPQASLPTNQITSTALFNSLAQAQYYFQTGVNYTLAATGQLAPLTNTPVQITAVTCAGTIGTPAVAVLTLAQNVTAANPVVDVTAISLSINSATGGGTPCATIAHGVAANPVSTVSVVGGVVINAATPWVVGNTYNVGWSVGVNSYVATGLLVSKAPNAVTNANLDLTFDRVLFTVDAVTDATKIFVSVPNVTPTASFEVYSCNLVSAKPINPEMKPFAFDTYLLEMVNMAPTTDFRRQVELPDSCDQVKMLTPLDTSLLSTRDTVLSYRNAIQSQDTTTMDVTVDNTTNGSLYYDRLINCVGAIKSLQPMNGGEEVMVIAETIPEPQPGINNVVEFRLQASGNTQQKSAYFFKRVAKSF